MGLTRSPEMLGISHRVTRRVIPKVRTNQNIKIFRSNLAFKASGSSASYTENGRLNFLTSHLDYKFLRRFYQSIRPQTKVTSILSDFQFISHKWTYYSKLYKNEVLRHVPHKLIHTTIYIFNFWLQQSAEERTKDQEIQRPKPPACTSPSGGLGSELFSLR